MTPLFLFAPGAGAPSTHLWMQQWKERLQTIGDVEIFDYAYTREHRKRPDPLPQLIAAHRQALAEAQKKPPYAVTILTGKSMGGPIGCHVSLTENVDGLVCLGYPRFAAFVASLYLGLNFLFAALYSFQQNSIAGSTGGHWFFDCFFFSVQTLATVGYGHMYPQTLYGHIVTTIEIMSGIFLFAVMT